MDLAMYHDTDPQKPDLLRVLDFENLRSLDLRNISGGAPTSMVNDIAMILIRWPNLRRLGLDVSENPHRHHTGNLLVRLATRFKHLREERGTPALRLQLQELVLGRGTATSVSPLGAPGQLHELTDLSKLQSLTILNNRITMWNDNQVFLNHRLFLEASNLKSLSINFFDRDAVALIRALSHYGSLQDIEIRSVSEREGYYRWYRSITELKGSWRRVLLGGRHERCPDNIGQEVFETLSWQSPDVEEIGLPYIRWVSSFFLLRNIHADIR